MPRYAQIDGDNICYAQSDLSGPISGPGIVEISEDDQVLGKKLVGGEWQDMPPAAPAIADISDRQFAQQLAALGAITEAEAIAWASRGDLPVVLEAAIDSLPDDGTRFSARMLLSSATIYERSHPMTATLGEMLGYDDADLDAMWRAAALL